MFSFFSERIVNVWNNLPVDTNFSSPLTFFLFIDELVWLLDKYGVKIKLCADDMKLYLRIVNDVDILVLQDALTAVYKWANE